MLALVGLATVIILLVVITSRLMSPLVALIVVPVTAAVLAGFGVRTAQFMLSIDSTWRQPRNDTRNIRWTRDFWNAQHRFSNGKSYFNFPGLLEEGHEAVERSYGQNYDRLARIKTAYDPQNALHLNQNIRPA